MNFETLAVHAGRAVEAETGAVTPSIVLSTTFERAEDGSYPHGNVYTRSGTPNRNALETAVAALEGGGASLAFGSGMAATAAVLQTLATGDHILLPDDLYHGVRYLVLDVLTRWGLAADFVNMSDPAAVEAAIRPTTKLVWLETPSNPQLTVTDIARLAALAHAAGALCAVDNTWATPVLQRPLELGADLVMHSATKYLGGHSDVLGGVVVLSANLDAAVAHRLHDVQHLSGGVLAPFDSWLILRSLPTLPYRVRAQSAAAGQIATFLHQHPRVAVTHYPGLPSDPGHEVARRQMKDFGGMISIQVRGTEADARAVANRLKLFTQATSLGGIESLVEHRASVEGPLTRTPPTLLRLSIGLEHPDDLMADLDQALGLM